MSDLSDRSKPLLAVFMVTYNHENYIEQAILSVVLQNVNFKVQLFIGEDKSTDGTLAICKNLEAQFPDIIRVVTASENIGVYKNASNVFASCLLSGAKYIALLEGDDYWSDPKKLQRQVDILEADDSIAGSYHNTEYLYKDGERKSMKQSLPLVMELKDVISKYTPFHTSSFVFRAKDFCRPTWFQKIDSVDLAMYVWHAQFGRLVGINEVMSTYRVHNSGITASVSHRENFDTRRIVLHRMMRGRVPHYRFDKYQELIDFHSSKTDDSWKSIIPNCTAFCESEENERDIAIRRLKMNLPDEIVNFRILDARFYVLNYNISLWKYSKFLNRHLWNNCFSSYVGRKPSAIIFTSQSSIDRFINYFGRMDIKAHFHFNVDSLNLEKYKNSFREICFSDSE